MDDNIPNRTDISDVKQDGNEKHVLDSSDKIVRWIKYKFEEQEIASKGHYENGLPFNRFIDLSNCIINTCFNDGYPPKTNLCDILIENDKVKLLECFINNGSGNRFHQEVLERVECTNSLIYSAFFHQTKFHKDVNFEGTEFKRYASFGNCTFEKYAIFIGAKFSGNFDFDRCTFNDNVYFKEAKFNIDQIHFGNSVFKGEFDAQKIEFLNDDKRHNISKANEPYIDFYRTEFHQELNLSQIDFTRGCYFTDAKFYSSVNFEKSHFKTTVTFNNAEINGNVLFTAHSDEKGHSEINENTIKNISFNGSTISGRIDFENCKIGELKGCFAKIKNGAILRIYESSIKSINLTSIYNNGVIMLEDNQANIEEITLKSAINSGVIEVENTEVQKITDRKTARVLKDAAYKSGNIIDALRYKPKEMDLYEKELIEEFKESWGKFNVQKLFITKKSFVDFYKSLPISEIALLKLNALSNNNGLNWIKGLLFTLSVWVLFFGIFVMCRDGIGNTFFLCIPLYREEFIKYLWLPIGFEGLFLVKSIGWGAISVFILGKIFIGYGIYQTISAFRKYGK